MMHMPAYIILQLYRKLSFDSNIYKLNISLIPMRNISEAYRVFGVHVNIFVLIPWIIMSKSTIYVKIMINYTNNNFK